MKRFFKDGETVLFQGDSVTDCGRDRSAACSSIESLGEGYPRLFKQIYDQLFPGNGVNFVNRGISGNKIKDLIDRYDQDFKAVKPDFISIMIGINDTWHGFPDDNTPPDRFKADYETLLQKIKADLPSAKLLIIEQFAFTAHPDRLGWDDDLAAKREATRSLAAKYADYFIPMYDVLMAAEKEEFTMAELSPDGVHPAPIGHSVIATQIMKTLGII